MGIHFITVLFFGFVFIIVVLLSVYSERRSIKRAFWGTVGSLMLALLATAIFEYGKSVMHFVDIKQKNSEKNMGITEIDDALIETNNEDRQKVDNGELVDSKQEIDEGELVGSEQEIEKTDLLYDDIPKVENIDDTVLEIRALYNEARANREVYIQKEISTGVIAFYKGEKLSFIEVNGEKIEEKYTRWYFYNNDELYFAFVFYRLQENRLYFCNNILFRYIDEEKNVHDNGYGISECPWEDIVREESQKYFEMSR